MRKTKLQRITEAAISMGYVEYPLSDEDFKGFRKPIPESQSFEEERYFYRISTGKLLKGKRPTRCQEVRLEPFIIRSRKLDRENEEAIRSDVGEGESLPEEACSDPFGSQRPMRLVRIAG